MAELLVKAKSHWMDDFTQKQIDEMTKEQKQSFDARSQIGDIIVVKPDGWEWGKEECLPNFVIIQVPDMTYDEAKIYEERVMDNTNPDKKILLKHRKYNVEKEVIELAKLKNTSKITKDKQLKIVNKYGSIPL